MKLHFHTKENKLIHKVNQFINEWNANSVFFETKTSGSTGIPKSVQIKKEFAKNSACATLEKFNISAGSNTLLALSMDTIGGKMMVVRSILGDLNLHVIESTSNPIKDFSENIDFLAIVPIQLAKILENCPEKLREIKTVIVGGGIISNELEKRLKEHEVSVYQTFGMTETISHIAIRKAGFEGVDFYETLSGIEIESENDQLIIQAPKIGVFNLKTNDLIEKIDSTHFIWKGRSDFVINSGGIKFIPEEIERELSHHIFVPFFVFGIPDDILGSKVILVIEGSERTELLAKEFYKFLRNPFSIPKEIAFLDKFCYTPSAKIKKLETLQKVNAIGTKKVL